MPCICDGAMTGDEFMDQIIDTPEYKEINELLIKASKLIKKQYDSLDFFNKRELYEQNQRFAWIKAFEHHLNGCDEITQEG